MLAEGNSGTKEAKERLIKTCVMRFEERYEGLAQIYVVNSFLNQQTHQQSLKKKQNLNYKLVLSKRSLSQKLVSASTKVRGVLLLNVITLLYGNAFVPVSVDFSRAICYYMLIVVLYSCMVWLQAVVSGSVSI
ncbi:hypothetical protein Hdeb2414_s0244g00845761 [Helianthus debilis subsp. tardiflorus]